MKDDNSNASTSGFNRRRFLRTMAIGASGAALSMGAVSRLGDKENEPAEEAPSEALVVDPVTTSGSPKDRVLVVIELEGGNDGLDTAIPYTDPLYRALRPSVGLNAEDVLAIDDEMGLNPNLAGLFASGVAIVEGVGMAQPDLSHFESSRRWWQGDAAGNSTVATGFLGRLCDELRTDEPVTGLSIGRGAAPALRSDSAVTLSVPDPWAGGGLMNRDDPFSVSARSGLAAMGQLTEGTAPLEALTRANLTRALDFLDVLESLPERDTDLYPGSRLSDQLATSARLLAADLGVRVIHMAWGNFDTHADHRSTHDNLMRDLDEAVTAFRVDLARMDRSQDVLIATTSEFGRRPAENDGGTDHGTASTMLLAGPTLSTRYGQTPSLSSLGPDDNLVATVGLGEYYATLAEGWFGIPADSVLADNPKQLPDVFIE